jgi:hypothetical protein
MVAFADDPNGELIRKVRGLRWVALIETFTYCLLLFFWIAGNWPGVAITGSIHGSISLGFGAGMILLTPEMEWGWGFCVLCIVTGPIGGIIAFARLSKGVPEELLQT